MSEQNNGDKTRARNTILVEKNGNISRKDESKLNKTGRTLSIRLFENYTKGQQKNRGCLYGNFECVEKRIREEDFDTKDKIAFLKQLAYLKEYLKYFNFRHIVADEEYFHSVENGLYDQLLIMNQGKPPV